MQQNPDRAAVTAAGVNAPNESKLEWISPEVTKLDLETAQQTGGEP